MGQVSITINDRAYRLACDAGEEDRLVELATYVKGKVEQLTAEIGHVGDERMMLMAALMIADELWDARAAASERKAAADPEPVRRLKKLAAKMAAAADGTAALDATADDAPQPGDAKARRDGTA